MDNHRVTPDNITSLKPNEVFVFGSNRSGRHGKGAAKTAMKWGAIYGQSFGLQGSTFAIPTVNASISKSLDTVTIRYYVDKFIQIAKDTPDLIFLVTEIGCGLAGKSVKEIAPLFKSAIDIENIHLPKKFWKIIQK